MIIFLSILVVLMAITLSFLIIKLSKIKKEIKKPAGLTKEEKKKLEKAREAFYNLMKYDYDEAIKRE